MCTFQRAYKDLKKVGKTAEAKEAEIAYNDAKHMAKHAVWPAKSEAEEEEFVIVSLDIAGVFYIANRWTTQTRTLLVRIVYATMLGSLRLLMKTRWRPR